MHLHFERNTNSKCDCAVLSLTWMGKVPDELPEDEGWKLNRTHYYQEGWLATGNVRGIVGVTFTTSHCKKAVDFPLRTNYNLRGHRSEVILVKWNEPYQKLASCDSSGIIFVWIKYEGRWSIELINDRNTPVTHFSWSHDGRMALICYQDGFVLVGSVAGQRYWSSMLNIESVITCGIWTPDDQQVYISTTGGQVIVMDVHGAMVSQVQLSSDVPITAMAWSCEKFKMEEGDDADLAQPDDRTLVLAVGFQNGYVYLMKSFDDVSPVQIHTGLCGTLRLEWSNSRELLAVAGSAQLHHAEYTNLLKFYSDSGVLLYSALIPYTQSPVTALTWGHNDKRLFVATGCQVHIAWVSRRIASLQLLCRLQIHRSLRGEPQLAVLPLPPRLKALIANLFAQTIRCCVPEVAGLREFVARPPAGSVRLHCTMIRHDEDTNMSSGSCYTLYLEYLGGLVPLLKGKRTSKIRPEFVIFDPQLDELMATAESTDSAKSSGSSQNAASDTSDTEREDGCGSPRIQRRRRRRHKSQPGDKGTTAAAAGSGAAAATGPMDKAPPEHEQQDDLAYVDTLPEHIRLVEVTSNIWGTKFKIHGLATSVPANLGQVTYKTSLLHLQPRQMTLVMTELRDDVPPDPDPTFNPNLFSEDEEELVGGMDGDRSMPDMAPPIAPMTPSGRFGPSCQSRSESTTTSDHPVPVLARAESYEDEFPYVELTDVANLCESLKQMQATPKSYVDGGCCNCPPVGIYSMGRTTNISPGPPQSARHAVSPLMCEGSVPTLQSPKNTVAPSDVLIERAAPSQAGGEVQRVKTVLTEQTTQCAVKLNLNLNLEEKRPVIVKRMNDAESVNNRMLHHTGCPSELSDITNSQKGATSSMNALNKRKDKQCGKSSPSGNQVGIAGRCPNKPEEMKYIDEDARTEPPTPDRVGNVRRTPTTMSVVPKSPACLAESMVRSCSVGYLDLVDAQLVPCEVALMMLRKETPKRLVLVNRKKQRRRNKAHMSHEAASEKSQCLKQPKLKQCGKSRSLDSSDIFPIPSSSSMVLGHLPSTSEWPAMEQEAEMAQKSVEASEVPPDPGSSKVGRTKTRLEGKSSAASQKTSSHAVCSTNYDSSETDCECPVDRITLCHKEPSQDETTQFSVLKGLTVMNGLSALDCLTARRKDHDDTRSLPSPSPCPSPRLPRSSPASPAPSKKTSKRNQSSSPIRKHLLNSPLLSRRQRKNKTTESSDDEVVHSSDEVFNGKNYRDLESFQKAQLRQKLKRGKCKLDGPEGSPILVLVSPRRREFVMHNKAPMWNENSQVYQLDFGGRVTQESAKNFQIEFRGKQVMQFGRIDGNAYTLDFQYPFSALQAFAVALANVTQRLK